ncbi:MAG: 3-deoxy-7-phosphoheptulonate synthase, partial [Planctomycetota bacterium]
MILILENGATDDQVQHVLDVVESHGLQTHLSRGTFRTIVGVVGDETKLAATPLKAISGVAEV